MKYLVITLIALFAFSMSFAQTNALLGQYFQNMPAYSPAQAGMYDYLDINLGLRQQWTGFKGSPQTFYLNAYGVARSGKEKSAHESVEQGGSGETPALLVNQKTAMKHGFGGYLLSDEQGPYKQSEIGLVYAIHTPIARGTYAAMGISPVLQTTKVDLSEVWVKDETNDDAYQTLLQNGASQTFLHLNIGLSVYSDKYYFSYGVIEGANIFLSGNEEINDTKTPIRHHILGGYRFFVSNNVELIPNTFIRLDPSEPAFFELGMRARYDRNIWTGLSYRNDHTLVGMFGLILNNKWKFGYAYEYKTTDITRYSNGSHEITLGMRLFNNVHHNPMW